MRSIIFACCILLFWTSTSASSPMTLKECIEQAILKNIQLKQSEINTENNKIAWKQAKQNRLPNLNASVSDGFSFGRSLSNSNVYVNQNSNSANANIGTDIPLFQGLKLYYEIQSRQLEYMASLDDHQKMRDDISMNVMSAFLSVLIQKELIKNAQDQLNLSDTLLKRSELLFQAGKEAVSKVYELRAQESTDAYKLIIAEKNHELALLDLAQILEIENTETFDIMAPEIMQSLSHLPIPLLVFDSVSSHRPEVQAESKRLESSIVALKVAKSAYSPSLDFSASASTAFYHSFNDIVLNDAFGKQLNSNMRASIGVSLSIPIFNRMQTKNNVSQSKLQIENQRLQLAGIKKTLFKDIQKAVLNAKASKERYSAAEKSVLANQTAYEYVFQRYESGVSTIFDLQQARTNLNNSFSEQIQSKYEFMFHVKLLDFYNGKPIE